MIAPMNEKFRKPRNVLIDPEIVHKARLRAAHARKTLGEWLEEAIEEKVFLGV